MTGAYFCSLVTKPDIIVAPGQYRTRSGETVSIDEVSTRHDFGCLGAYPDGTRERWHKSGRLYATMECANDIITIVGHP
ncbi:MAG: hypothetical protein JSS57_07230 [Proteobacteria bacterium]|nr:hypothetical protein [Pseudomonadota bacterium]